MCVLVAQSCLTSWTVARQASLVHEILQARILKWVAFPFSRESSWPRVRTRVSCTAGSFFTIWVTRDSLKLPGVWYFAMVAQLVNSLNTKNYARCWSWRWWMQSFSPGSLAWGNTAGSCKTQKPALDLSKPPETRRVCWTSTWTCLDQLFKLYMDPDSLDWNQTSAGCL